MRSYIRRAPACALLALLSAVFVPGHIIAGPITATANLVSNETTTLVNTSASGIVNLSLLIDATLSVVVQPGVGAASASLTIGPIGSTETFSVATSGALMTTSPSPNTVDLSLAPGESVSIVGSGSVDAQAGPTNDPTDALATIVSISTITNLASSTGTLEFEGTPGGELVSTLTVTGSNPGQTGIASGTLASALANYYDQVIGPGSVTDTIPYPDFAIPLSPGQSVVIPSAFTAQAIITPEPGTLLLTGSLLVLIYCLRRRRAGEAESET